MKSSLKSRQAQLIIFLVVLGIGGGLYAFNQDPDDTWHRRIPYQGYLERDGIPLSESVSLSIELYAVPTGGTDLWSEDFTDTQMNAGRFSLILGDKANNGIPAEVFAAREALYLQVLIDDVAIGARQRVIGTPFSSSSGIPPGMIMPFGGTTGSIPAGWLYCDGSSVLRNDYPALYAAVGNAHGSVDSTHFNLPDYRGRFLRGTSDAANIDPNKTVRGAANPGGNSGNSVGSIQADATARPNSAFSTTASGNHNHTNGNFNRLMITGTDSGTCSRSFAGGDVSCGEPDLARSASIAANGNHAHTVSGGGDNETRPANASVNFLMKY